MRLYRVRYTSDGKELPPVIVQAEHAYDAIGKWVVWVREHQVWKPDAISVILDDSEFIA